MDYDELVEKLTVFKTENSVSNWIRANDLIFDNKERIILLGNSHIKKQIDAICLDVLKKENKNLEIDISCQLSSAINMDANGFFSRMGVGAGLGATVALVESGPVGWLVLAGGAVGALFGRGKVMNQINALLVHNSAKAAKIYAEYIQQVCSSEKNNPAKENENVQKENTTLLSGTISTVNCTSSNNEHNSCPQPDKITNLVVKTEKNILNQQSSVTHSSSTLTMQGAVTNDRIFSSPSNIRVNHKILGKGTIAAFTQKNAKIHFDVKFADSTKTFVFPSIFIDQNFHGVLDIEKDLVNCQNVINYMAENKLIDYFPENTKGDEQISWMQECVDRYRLLQLFKKFGFAGFLHTTQFYNFKSIYQSNQMLSRKTLADSGKRFIDCAETSIIGTTDDSVKSNNRFYYRCKTPTNYSAFHYHGQNNPVIFALDEKCIYDTSVVFYDGNARANKSIYTTRASHAYSFNWKCIFSTLPPYNNEHTDAFIKQQNCTLDDLKRMQNAEFLFKDNIDISYFDKIYFMTKYHYEEAVRLFGANGKFEYKPSIFPAKRYL
jgi:hypothetical protein